MSRIFITGDCHGEYTKLGYKSFPKGRDLTKDDFVIICGDFGYWDHSSEQEYWMDWLEARPFSVLWIDGSNENFDLLKQLPVQEWRGGKVHFIRPSVIHLMRGQMFTIDGKRFFTFGGARSHDIEGGILERDDPLLKMKARHLKNRGEYYRINHVSWWAEEMPDDPEKETGLRTLETAGWETDYIITHCCATQLLGSGAGAPFEGDALTDYFSLIRERCQYGRWFFGHYHVDEEWNAKDICLYQRIVELTDEGYRYCDAGRRSI